MAVTQIKVPMDGNSAELTGWIENASAVIDAGNDVEFINRLDESNVDISRIQLDTAGFVSVWGRAFDKTTRKRVYLEAGGWHVMPGIHGIAADDTQTGKGIHVKI